MSGPPCVGEDERAILSAGAGGDVLTERVERQVELVGKIFKKLGIAVLDNVHRA